MKRETCLRNATKRLNELTLNKDMIASISLLVPVIFNFRCPIRSKGWAWETIRLVGEVVDFNNLSLRVTMIAIDNEEAYPFDLDKARRVNNKPTHELYPLAFKRIEAWAPYDPKDLLLLLGWPIQYPRLAELLKKGPPKRSLAELGASISKVPKKPWTVVGFESVGLGNDLGRRVPLNS